MISKNQIKFIRQLEQKKHRSRTGCFVAEGPKVVGDMMTRYRPALVCATDEGEGWQTGVGSHADCELMKVSDEELRRISFLQHPQQVLAVMQQTGAQAAATLADDQLVLALDGIQDPGNLGTIIRMADWFGIDSIWCSPDTADAWSPKVVQAAMGSLAHIHIGYTPLPDLLDRRPGGLPVYGTLLDGEDIYQQALTARGVIVMGNEGKGLSAAVRQRVTNRLLIPKFREGAAAESLNVAIATAIVCSEFRRRG